MVNTPERTVGMTPLEYERAEGRSRMSSFDRQIGLALRALMYLLGPIGAVGAMLAAGGNGWSPSVFFLLGAVGTPLVAAALSRWLGGRSWVTRWAALGLTILLSVALAPLSMRVNKDVAFVDMLGIPMPTGVTMLEARRQWYDGPNTVIAFQSNRAGIDAMLAARKFESLDIPAGGFRSRLIAPISNLLWLLPPTSPTELLWDTQFSLPSGGPRMHYVSVCWDPSTGHGAILGFKD